MSPKLELTELIEKYLRNELLPQDKIDFEKRMTADASLKQDVELQREVMQGIERAALKQKAENAWKQYRNGKNFLKWGLSALTVMLVAGAILYYMNSASNSSASSNELPALNENGDTLWADADKILPGQKFTIDTRMDTVIVTEGGIVMAIPANAFVDESGQPASGTVELEVKEALDPATIIKAGLSTRAGNEPLETGGMFYINARQDDKSLKIDPAKGIYTKVPASEVKPGMMLFEGERKQDGTIDWIKPKPLVKDLIPVDILSLNFYPPNYLDSLEGMGYSRKNKKFTDSLYYSFAAEFGPLPANAPPTGSPAAPDSSNAAPVGSNGSPNISISGYSVTAGSETYWPKDTLPLVKGINPAKVKAIWNKNFQNTILSTREFEQRMKHIHRSCENAVLDMYVNNLDKNLSTIDSMAAGAAGSQREAFMQFAARGDGKVSKPAKHLDKLREFYEQQSKLTTEAIAKTNREFRAKHQKLDEEATKKTFEQIEAEGKRKSEDFMKELNMNLDEAYRQLGKKKPTFQPGTGAAAVVTTTGWNNVDRYVLESTINRTTLDYTDPESGKKAVIQYKPLTVKVNQRSTYERVLVYLLPDKLSSFMRAKEEKRSGTFTESRNELISYKLVVIGYKGTDVYMHTKDVLDLDSYTIDLVKTTQGKADKQINSMSSMSVAKSMKDEMDFQIFDVKDVKRREMVKRKEQLRARIRPVVFPCEAACQTVEGFSMEVAEKLFQQQCAVCHSTGSNVITGPGLAGVASRVPSKNWFIAFVRNAEQMKKQGDAYAVAIDKLYPGTMNPFTFLSDCEIESIYQYLVRIESYNH